MGRHCWWMGVALKVFEDKMGIVENLEGHSELTCSIDISDDTTLLANVSDAFNTDMELGDWQTHG
jgi:hypothetical protein